MKILLFGSNGMAGHMIYHSLKYKYKIITAAKNNADIIVDICDVPTLEHIQYNNYDIIINAIGLLVKESNSNNDKAILINSWFPHYLESKTKNTKTKVIHLSTDCVFSGKKGKYTELSIKDGSDFYAKSKSFGELDNEKDLTIRTSIIGPEIKNGTGLFHWFMNQNDQVQGFSKVYWNGLTTLELSKIIDICIDKNISGILNVPSDIISKYKLLKIINKTFNNKIKIARDDSIKSNKTISTIRNDLNYQIPSHEIMIEELKKFILNNKHLYKYSITIH